LEQVQIYGYIQRAKVYFDEITSAFKKLDENLAAVEKFNSEGHPPNFLLVFSEKAKNDTEGFQLSINMSDPLYHINIHTGLASVCPLETSYRYSWIREGIDPSENFQVKDNHLTVLAVNSNWLGNQTKVYYLPKGTDLSKVSYDNVASFQ